MSKFKTATTRRLTSGKDTRDRVKSREGIPDWIRDPDDPLDIVRRAPAWFRDLEVEKLPMTVRLRNVFTHNRIKIISDLDRYSKEEFFALRNIGVNSGKHLAEALIGSLRSGFDARGAKIDSFRGEVEPKSKNRSGRGASADLSAAISLGLVENLVRSLDQVGARDRRIVFGRMGYKETPKTLGSLGREYGLTRERIRQIEQRSLDVVIHSESCGDLMLSRLKTLFKKREKPLRVSNLEREDDWFRGVTAHEGMIEYLIEKFCGKQFHVFSLRGVDYISHMDQNAWDVVVKDARKMLKKSVGLILSEDECRRRVGEFLPDHGRELEPLLWAEVSRFCHFSGLRNQRILTSYGRGKEHLIQVLLEDSPAPLHVSKVDKMLEDITGRKIGVSRIQSGLTASGTLLGKGTFGSRRHIPLSDAELEKLAAIVAKVVTGDESGDRQWHALELVDEVKKKNPKLHEKIDKYLLNAALKRYSNLKYLGRFIWTQPEDKESRVHIREATLEILKEAGHPLAAREIKERISGQRGLGQNFQINNRDPLLRVDRGVWGLNDRDFAVKRDRQPDLIETIVDALTRKKSGIRVDEVDQYVDFPPSMSGDAVFSIATLDDRMAVGVGRIIYLKKWGNPRG